MPLVQKTSFYRFLKWTWLLSQCALPFLAALYWARFFPPTTHAEPEAVRWTQELGRILLSLVGAFYLILWLMAEALLCMYRFPLHTPGALKLELGFFIQFVLLLLTGGSPLFAAYAGLYVSIAALFVCLALLLFAYERRRLCEPGGPSTRQKALELLGSLAAALVGFLPLAVLFGPLWAGFQPLDLWVKAVNGLVLLANTWLNIRSLIDLSIWGRPDPLKPQYDAEWERWAGPTIGLLILAATGAIVALGVSRAS
mgnify:CR=1 FL=1